MAICFKSIFLLQMHLCIIEEFEVFVKFGKFFYVLYFKLLSNFYQAFIGFEKGLLLQSKG
jgi:hypothetical protein